MSQVGVKTPAWSTPIVPMPEPAKPMATVPKSWSAVWTVIVETAAFAKTEPAERPVSRSPAAVLNSATKGAADVLNRGYARSMSTVSKAASVRPDAVRHPVKMMTTAPAIEPAPSTDAVPRPRHVGT